MFQLVDGASKKIDGALEGVSFEENTTKLIISHNTRVSEVVVPNTLLSDLRPLEENILNLLGGRVEVQLVNGAVTEISFPTQ